jgi:hypothetical protein
VEEIATHEANGKPLEIWFADEARIGQKNKITRRWAKRGTRPSVPRDLRTASAYIFGAICPAEGKGAGLGHHVHRLAGLGSWVLITGTWYKKPNHCGSLAPRRRRWKR